MEYENSSKKIRFYHSLKFKTALLLSFIIAVIFCLYGFYSFNIQKQKLLDNINEERSRIIRRLTNYFTDAIQIEDINYLNRIISLEVQNKNVVAIIITKINKNFNCGKIKLNDKLSINYDPSFVYDVLKENTTLVVKKNIKNDNISIAYLKVYFTNKNFNNDLYAFLQNLIVLFVFIEFAVVIVLYFSINSLIVRQLENLKYIIRDLLQKGSGDIVEIKSNDEIGSLIFSINNLLKEILKQKESTVYREIKYKALFTKANTGIAIIRKGILIECNTTVNDIYKYKKEQLLGKTILELFPEDQRNSNLANKLLEVEKQADKRTTVIEMNHCQSDGNMIDVEYVLSRIDIEGRACLYAVIRDITERKRYENKIKASEERLYSLVQNSPDIIFSVSLEGELFTSLNHAFEKITSWKCEEWIGKPFYTIIHSEDVKKIEDLIEKVKNGESTKPCGLRLLSKSGVYLTIEILAVPQWQDGKIIGFYGSGRDITQIVVQEQEAKNACDFMNNIMNHMADPLYVKDDQHKWIFLNDAFSDFIGLPINELIGKSDCDFLPKEEAEMIWKSDDLIFTVGLSDENEESFTDINHKKNTILTKKSTFTDSNGKNYLIGIIRDFTERKIAEESIKASLNEKEILLKEIHHRVKNNLQIISSLLHIQATYIKDPESLRLFKNSQTRVRSMALIHEKLYQSKNLARINFGGYVHDIATHLFRIYHININEVALRIEIPKDIYLSVDTAIPCGLIINEILTNSLKYGFNIKKNGEVFIIFCMENNNYKLIIGDDGDKIPENIDFRNLKTLGLQLVSILANQLKGSLEMKFTERKEFSISFPAI